MNQIHFVESLVTLCYKCNNGIICNTLFEDFVAKIAMDQILTSSFLVCIGKGQIISKHFFLAKDSSEKRTKTSRILVKTNSFVRFLGES